MVSKNSLLHKAHPRQYLDALLLASSVGADLPSPVATGTLSAAARAVLSSAENKK